MNPTIRQIKELGESFDKDFSLGGDKKGEVSAERYKKLLEAKKQFITHSHLKLIDSLIEELKGMKIGQNVIINCVSRNDNKTVSEYVCYNTALSDTITYLKEIKEYLTNQ